MRLENRGIDSLPRDLRLKALQCLDHSSICTLVSVNKEFSQLAQAKIQQFWQTIRSIRQTPCAVEILGESIDELREHNGRLTRGSYAVIANNITPYLVAYTKDDWKSEVLQIVKQFQSHSRCKRLWTAVKESVQSKESIIVNRFANLNRYQLAKLTHELFAFLVSKLKTRPLPPPIAAVDPEILHWNHRNALTLSACRGRNKDDNLDCPDKVLPPHVCCAVVGFSAVCTTIYPPACGPLWGICDSLFIYYFCIRPRKEEVREGQHQLSSVFYQMVHRLPPHILFNSRRPLSSWASTTEHRIEMQGL